MEYIYAALLLHKLGKPVDEDGLKKVISATGIEVDEAKVKLLVANLKDVNIDEELEKAVAVSAAPAAETESEKPAAKEEKKEEKASAAAEGLSSLFG
jgi:large subunit ribosomal protein L12